MRQINSSLHDNLLFERHERLLLANKTVNDNAQPDFLCPFVLNSEKLSTFVRSFTNTEL